MAEESSVPSYEPMLAAYHRAFARELREILEAVPIRKGQLVLDLACGDGAYLPWLAERLGGEGRIVAADMNPALLELAQRHVADFAGNTVFEFSQASAESLPFAAGSFDVCWCAQSLYSLPDPVRALEGLRAVTKPDGVVAVLEADSLHHVILPWPADAELALRAAELRRFVEDSDKPGKFYVGRHLRRVFRAAGLTDIHVRTFAADRSAPLGPDERLFLTEYLMRLGESVAGALEGAGRRRFEELVDPGSPRFLLNDPDLTATCILQLAWARPPGSRPSA